MSTTSSCMCSAVGFPQEYRSIIFSSNPSPHLCTIMLSECRSPWYSFCLCTDSIPFASEFSRCSAAKGCSLCPGCFFRNVLSSSPSMNSEIRYVMGCPSMYSTSCP